MKNKNMKKFLMFFGVFMVFTLNTFANSNPVDPKNERIETAAITIESANSKINFDFNSFEEFKNYSEKIVESTNELILPDDSCSITITMSVTVTVNGSVGIAGGSISTTVTGSVTCSCSGAVAAGQRLRSQLIAMAGG